MPAPDEDPMNVTCPQCHTVFRVDPAKVPEKGVRARCSVCSGLIAVRRPPLAVPPEVAPRIVEPVRPAPGPEVRVPVPPPTPPVPPVAPVVPAVVTPPAPPPPPPPTPAPPTVEAWAPPAPAAPAAPPAAAPVAPASPPPVTPPLPRREVAPEPGATGAGRFANPFLQQDPATRARRLARALVSDLVVYHPEKRQRGLAEGNLKDLFAEEIRKSWEEYTDQVGQDLANSTSYFTEALNEILAEGRAMFD